MNDDSAGKDDGAGSESDRNRKFGQSTSGFDGLDVDDGVGQARVGQVEGDDDVAFHGGVRRRESNPGLAETGREFGQKN